MMQRTTPQEALARADWRRPDSRWSLFVERHPVLLFTTPALVVVFVLMVFPVFYTLYMSLHSWFASSLTKPEFVGLANFKRAFTQDERFRNALWLTLYFTTLATALQVFLGVALALLLHRPFRGKGFFRSIFLLPMASSTSTSLPATTTFNNSAGIGIS